MGFALDELFIKVGVDDKPAVAALGRIRGGVDRLKPAYDAASAAAKAFLVAAAAGLGLAVKQAGDFGETASKFEAVFKDQTAAATAWATSFAAGVGRSKAELMGFMASVQSVTAALGFSRADAAKLSQTITQLAVDLASFNNMSDSDALLALQSGILSGEAEPLKKFGVIVNDAALDAELMKMGIKGGSDAASEQQKVLARLNITLRATKDAQGDALKTSGSFANQLRAVRGSVMDAAVEIGNAFLPALTALMGQIRPVVVAFGQWAKANQQTIITMVKWAGAVAGAIVLAPMLIAGIKGAVVAFMGLGQILLGVGQTLLWLVTSPIGLVIAGIAAVVAALVYFAGSGDKASARFIDGLMRIVQFMDQALGSWQGFTTSIGMLWDQAINYVAQGLTVFKNWILNGWEFMAEGIEHAWWSAFEGMYETWTYLQTGAQKFMNWISRSWEKMTDFLGDKLYDAWAAASDLFDDRPQAEKDAEKKYLEDMRAKESGSKDAEYKAAQKAIDDEYNFRVAAMRKQVQMESDAARQKRETKRAENDKERADALALLEDQRKAALKEAQATLAQQPKLSDRLKTAYESLRKATGLDDMLKAVDDVKAELDKLKQDAAAGAASPDGIKGAAKEGGKNKSGKDVERKSLEDTFKDSLARSVLGQSLMDQQKKQQEEEQKKLAKERTKNTQKTAKAVEDVRDILKEMKDRPAGATFA